jgi:PiT family inorganic phosphate transporter
MDHFNLLFVLAILFGLFMAWGVGANDVANAMGTSVGSRALTIKQAIIVAAIFEFAGAFFAGGQVTDTIRGKIIDPSLFQGSPELMVYGMLSALLAAGSWLAIASFRGWPVSTTHTIVGAILGFGLMELGVDAINWQVVIKIALSWVVTPLISAALAYYLFLSVKKLIFVKSRPEMLLRAKRYIPIFMFLTSFIVSIITFTKGLKHLNINISYYAQVFSSLGISLFLAIIGMLFIDVDEKNKKSELRKVEAAFAKLMVFTASAMAFSHGSNDVANAIGPLAAVVDILDSGMVATGKSSIPPWVLLLGGTGIVLGLATYGYRVIATIGEKITELTPSRGFAAELATASTVVIASGVGLPVSTTQTLVGAILGVGFARGIAALRLNVIKNIFLSWVITLPAGALLTIVYYNLFLVIL